MIELDPSKSVIEMSLRRISEASIKPKVEKDAAVTRGGGGRGVRFGENWDVAVR
jgi:hypothetical protein